jgi:adenylosuccinate synthase
MEGWKEELSDAREFGDLPKTTQKYVRRLEELTGVEISMISVGAERNQTIIRKNPFRA